jgi:PAS domain S-box-containing protein
VSVPYLRLEAVDLLYGSQSVLREVDIAVSSGRIHAIVGEHGAGKTSIAKVMEGSVRPSAGSLWLEGSPIPMWNRKDAAARGVYMVRQEARLNARHSVAENLVFGIPGSASSPFRPYFPRRVEREARAFLEEEGFDLDLDPAAVAGDLKIADQTLVAILRALRARPRLLILDESLELLASTHRNKIVARLKRSTSEGAAVVVITHRIDELYEIAQMVSVMRDGRVLLTEDAREIEKINLLKMAYTQIGAETSAERNDREFYRLIKYNEAILKQLPVAVLVADHTRSVRLANDVARRMLDINGNEALSLPFEELFPEGSEELGDMLSRPALRAAEGVRRQLRLRLKGGSILANCIAHPVFDGPAFLGSLLIIEDVTERESLQERMILSEKLASVGLLAAGVAHEINNPLAIIYNYLDALKFEEIEGSPRSKIVSDLEEQFEYIAAIVENLVTFSDTTKPIEEEVELRELVSSIIRLIEDSAKSKGITIDFRPGEPIRFLSNRNELKQVFLNLFKNSFEAMSGGGSISIETDQTRGADCGDETVVRFRDTGPGILFENLRDIFLPFTSTKKQLGSNLGLGLSVSYGIMRKHGGDISVANREGGGCEFTLRFPMGVKEPFAAH